MVFSAIVWLAGDRVIPVGTAPPDIFVMAHTVGVEDMTKALFTTGRKFPVPVIATSPAHHDHPLPRLLLNPFRHYPDAAR
jgi:hypothetical protein